MLIARDKAAAVDIEEDGLFALRPLDAIGVQSARGGSGLVIDYVRLDVEIHILELGHSPAILRRVEKFIDGYKQKTL